MNGYYKYPEDYINEAFDHPGFPSDFHIALERCGLFNDVTHIPALAARSKIIREFTTMTPYRCQSRCQGYEER